MSTVSKQHTASVLEVTPVKKATVSKKTAAAAAKAPTAVAETKVETTPAVTETAPVPAPATELTPEEELTQGFQEIFSRVIDITTAAKTLNQTAKALFKRYTHLVRNTRRRKTATTTATGENVKPKPSGFLNPVTLSPEMYAFLEVAPGTEMTRTQVTKRIYNYVQEHTLQNPENKRIILPDAALRELLKVPETVELTYFNIQTYMKPHFIKKAAAAPVEVQA